MKKYFVIGSKHTFILGAVVCCCIVASLSFNVWRDAPGCAISLDKQNVFYIGVDNPISVVVRGVPLEQVSLSGEGLSITKGTGDFYTVRATTPGEGSIKVTGGGLNQTFKYRIKRIPDPALRLGGSRRSGSIGNGEFKAQGGIAAVLENFDFDARCDVVSYEITYLPKRNDPVTQLNTGARFGSAAIDLVNRAKPGDAYFFDEIKVRCPGDAAARNLGAMVFKIK
jgi:hypothetical protein